MLISRCSSSSRILGADDTRVPLWAHQNCGQNNARSIVLLETLVKELFWKESFILLVKSYVALNYHLLTVSELIAF